MSMPRLQLAPAGTITREFLQSFVGQTVEDFCPNGTKDFAKVGDTHNHCAHFVSHALGFQIGKLCNTMSYANRKNTASGRSLVVSDLFNACPERGLWSARPAALDCCLIFAVGAHGASQAANGQWTMANIPRKHVGIHLNGECYNYHNTHNEGVGVNAASFFEKLYGAGTTAFYGTFPV
jgi:hypothetical protein